MAVPGKPSVGGAAMDNLFLLHLRNNFCRGRRSPKQDTECWDSWQRAPLEQVVPQGLESLIAVTHLLPSRQLRLGHGARSCWITRIWRVLGWEHKTERSSGKVVGAPLSPRILGCMCSPRLERRCLGRSCRHRSDVVRYKGRWDRCRRPAEYHSRGGHPAGTGITGDRLILQSKHGLKASGWDLERFSVLLSFVFSSLA